MFLEVDDSQITRPNLGLIPQLTSKAAKAGLNNDTLGERNDSNVTKILTKSSVEFDCFAHFHKTGTQEGVDYNRYFHSQ